MHVHRRSLRAARFPAAVAFLAGALLLALHPAGCSEDKECSRDQDCDDGVFCNGQETCGRTGRCYDSPSGACDDGRSCNVDTCVEATRDCSHLALDRDADTFQDADCGGDDCDDAAAGIHPGAIETCDFLDDDCDGRIDEDRDGDHHQDRTMCPAGDDCDDARAEVYLDAPELCDGLDNDCDGVTTDERDTDGDTAVDAGCAGGTDCDDEDPNVRPGTDETCNDKDDDCDGDTDEAVGTCRIGDDVWCFTVCGSRGTGVCTSQCRPPEPAGCDPPAEACGNGVDDNCDGETNEDCSTPDAGCVNRGDECCGDLLDDNCDGRTDEFGCLPHGACPPLTRRYCDTGDEYGWGYQDCPISGTEWGPCDIGYAPPGCEPMGWDVACCVGSGSCCQDTGDANDNGFTTDSAGPSCPPQSNCL
ncbi:MAG: putative metal-binding motif-containing protein [Deltaproteobacteria bacterium]|nr:putative metal-binding motif-containing protein [Deltaproteobacteria bacterium]